MICGCFPNVKSVSCLCLQLTANQITLCELSSKLCKMCIYDYIFWTFSCIIQTLFVFKYLSFYDTFIRIRWRFQFHLACIFIICISCCIGPIFFILFSFIMFVLMFREYVCILLNNTTIEQILLAHVMFGNMYQNH